MRCRRLLVAAALIAVGAAPAAADYRSGVEAWGRGDFAAAARAFLPAAQAGDAESQYMMGRLYSLGDGVPRDFVQAWVWFDRAARQGHQLAAEARESMDHVLNAAQLAQAHALAVPPSLAQAPPPLNTQQQAAAPPEATDTARAVVLVPRRGVVTTTTPARLTAHGPTDEGRVLAADDGPARIREVQRALRASGVYAGALDGVLGPATRAAIRADQRAHGESETGHLSARLLARAGADQQQAAR
jgi:hypothetical protein